MKIRGIAAALMMLLAAAAGSQVRETVNVNVIELPVFQDLDIFACK